jgi:hypothetical protein
VAKSELRGMGGLLKKRNEWLRYVREMGTNSYARWLGGKVSNVHACEVKEWTTKQHTLAHHKNYNRTGPLSSINLSFPLVPLYVFIILLTSISF